MDVDKDNNTLVYNGENKLVTYNGGATNGGANYVYDGDSKRVMRISRKLNSDFTEEDVPYFWCK